MSGNTRGRRLSDCFLDERATPAVLQFLRDTRVGKMITLVPRVGNNGEWEGLEGKELLWPEEDGGQGVCGKQGWPGPP